MKTPLLLLHGALGAAAQFDELKAKLAPDFEVFTFDFSGHGNNSYDGILTMDKLKDDILSYLDAHHLIRVDIFGYSMGGYAAVTLAALHPERMRRIMTLGTKWQWSPELANQEVKMLDPETILSKVPNFAEVLRHRHPGQGWRALLHQTAGLITHLGYTGGLKESDLRRVELPVLVCLGSADRMVSVEESESAATWMPAGRYHVLQDVPHALEKVDTDTLVQVINQWFGENIGT